jgi:autotransporter family porin
MTADIGGSSSTVSGALTLANGLTKAGLGSLTFTADNSGTTTVDVLKGGIQLGDGGTTGSFGTGTINLAGATSFTVNRSDNVTIASDLLATGTDPDGALAGGALVKQGSGTLTLSGANTYADGSSVLAGVLKPGTDGALGSGNVTVLSGAQLDLNGRDIANNLDLAGAGVDTNDDGTVDNAGALRNSTGTATVTGNVSLEPDAVIQANGGIVIDGDLALGEPDVASLPEPNNDPNAPEGEEDLGGESPEMPTRSATDQTFTLQGTGGVFVNGNIELPRNTIFNNGAGDLVFNGTIDEFVIDPATQIGPEPTSELTFKNMGSNKRLDALTFEGPAQLGASQGAVGVHLEGAAQFDDTVTLKHDATIESATAGITFGGAVSSDGMDDRLTLITPQGVTQGASGSIKVDALALKGETDFTLTNAGNEIGTLAAGTTGSRVGALTVVSTGDMTIGAVDGLTGIQSSGVIDLKTTGANLTVSKAIDTPSDAEPRWAINSTPAPRGWWAMPR